MEIFPYKMFLAALHTFMCGVAMGVLYDVLRLTRAMLGYRYISSDSAALNNPFVNRFKRKKNTDISKSALFKTVLFFEDLIFSLVFCAVLILAIFYGNGGAFRFIFPVSMFVGFFAYYFSAGKLTVLFFDVCALYIRSFICYLLYYLFLPARFLFGRIYPPLKKFFTKFKQTLENIRIKGYNKKEETPLASEQEKGMLNSEGRVAKCRKRKRSNLAS